MLLSMRREDQWSGGFKCCTHLGKSNIREGRCDQFMFVQSSPFLTLVQMALI